MKYILLFTLHVLFFENKTIAQDSRLNNLEVEINEVLKSFIVPGASVAVVEKQKVLLAEGYGYSDLAKNKKSSNSTLFMIGSCTKAFTCALLGKMAESGSIKLNNPLSQYLPQLKFKDHELTENVTILDAMTHRSGLPRHDFAWILRNNSTRMDLVKSIVHFDATTPLRTSWQYNNFMYAAQGALIEEVSGFSWEKMISDSLLKPLGMLLTKVTTKDMLSSYDYAKAYHLNEKDKKVIEVPHYRFQGMEPAGSISSNAIDMAQWLKLWINNGESNSKKILSSEYISDATKIHMAMGNPISLGQKFDVHTFGYGLGWMIRMYKGKMQIEHGGNIDGFSTTVSYFPFDSIGIFVSVNQGGSAAANIIRNIIADRLLKVKKTYWLTELAPDLNAQDTTTTHDLMQIKGTSLTHGIESYTGSYENIGYGTHVIDLIKDTLTWKAGIQTYKLLHYHYNTFKIVDSLTKSDNEGLKLNFRINAAGKISGFDIPLEQTSTTPIFFKKIAGNDAKVDGKMDHFVGIYTLQGIEVKISLHDNHLKMSVPGQPEYTLERESNNVFLLKGIEGFSVHFEVVNGKVTALNSVQPNGTFRMTRKDL